jgi:hypothetical protein
VAVEFCPTAHGTQTGTLNFATDSLEPTPVVALIGTGLTRQARLSVNLVDFGTVRVGEMHSSLVIVTSAGDDPVTILDVAIHGSFGQTNDCTSSLAPGATCNIWVTFSPTDRVASWGDLSLSTDGVYTSGVRLQGRGGVPIASVTPTALTFERTHVGKLSQAQMVSIANVGDLPLLLDPVVATGDFEVANRCGSIVYPGSSCYVSVWFAPSMRGDLTGQLVVGSDSADLAAPVELAGTAFGPK